MIIIVPYRKPYIIDTKTSNISFKQTAADLKRLGIKNNLFFLRLYDRRLQGIDPYNKLLPENVKIAIINECIRNPWYYITEVARIPEQGTDGIPFELHRGNLAILFLFFNGIDGYITIPRQKGKTQSILGGINWAFLFGTTNSEMLFINIDERGAINNLNRLKAQRELLPDYLRMDTAYDDERDKFIDGTNKNVKSLVNFTNGNKIITAVRANSVQKADQTGRGYSQPIQYFDEFEFIDHIATIMEAAGPAYGKAADNAKKNNAVYGRIFSSTPGDDNTKTGQEAATVLECMCKFTEHMYDIFDTGGKEALEQYIDLNGSNGIVYIEFSYKQLGEDESWLKRMSKVVNNKPEKIRRELLLQRISGANNSPFSAEDLMSLETVMKDVIEEKFIMPNFKLDIYEHINPQKCYFIGVDVSNGYGADNSAVCVFDPYEMRIVAEFQSPFIGTTDLYRFLRLLIKRLIPRGILCIERNMNGESVIAMLRESDVRHAVFHSMTQELFSNQATEKLDSKGLLKLEAAKRRLYGVYTKTKSREKMFTLLDKYMTENKHIFTGKMTVNDIKKLVKKNGKIQAGEGFHDDMIMALLMCLYVYTYATNLNMFGFYKGEFIPDEEINEREAYNEIKQLLNENEELRNLYGNPDNNIGQLETSDDYSKKIMMEIQKVRKELGSTQSYHDSNGDGVNVTVQNYSEDVTSDFDNPMSGYETIDSSFFDYLNN